jgi:hypothetical protein
MTSQPGNGRTPHEIAAQYLFRTILDGKCALRGNRDFAGLPTTHDPEKHVLDLIGDGTRFSDKIMWH